MKKLLALSLLLLLCIVSTSHAAYDPIGSGTTKLTLDKRFVKFLKENAIELSATSPAKGKGTSLTLPISGGVFDPTTGEGSIDQEGSIVFQSAKGKVPLRKVTLKTKSSPLIAKVGGSQLKIATSKALKAKREGFGSSFSAAQLKLTAKVATRLNKKLRPKVDFKEGQPFGSLLSKPQPRLFTVAESGRATLALDPAFFAKLDQRFVSLNPISPAERQGLSFSFPIAAGGAIAPDGAEGTLRTAGAIELLQLGAGQVFWREFWLDLTTRSDTAEVDIEPTPAFPGKIGRVGVLGLVAPVFVQDPATRTVTLTGAPLTLAAETAGALNGAFAQGQGAFGAGEVVGTLSFGAVGE